MYRDEIIEEVWRNRDAYALEHHNDLDEIVADLRRREQLHPEKVIEKQSHRVGSSVLQPPHRDR